MPRRRTLRALGLLLPLWGCASFNPAPPEVQLHARGVSSWSAELSVRLRARGGRVRTRALLAFRKPTELRAELPGPTGPRLVVVTKDGVVSAVFPHDRAFFQGPADEAAFHALLGVALEPQEIMDLLLGQASPRLRDVKIGWGLSLPEQIEATLPDGVRLSATVKEPREGMDFSLKAFLPPPHDGFRSVTVEEARELLEHL
jgi:hypothetical protein